MSKGRKYMSPVYKIPLSHLAEREVMEKIKNPFLVQMFYAFQSGHKLYFILEYCNGGNHYIYIYIYRGFVPSFEKRTEILRGQS